MPTPERVRPQETGRHEHRRRHAPRPEGCALDAAHAGGQVGGGMEQGQLGGSARRRVEDDCHGTEGKRSWLPWAPTPPDVSDAQVFA